MLMFHNINTGIQRMFHIACIQDVKSACYWLQVFRVYVTWLLFTSQVNMCVSMSVCYWKFQRVRIYLTISHQKYSACQSVCYSFTLQALSVSECMLLFHITIFSLSECMVMFHITYIQLVRVYGNVYHYIYLACQSVCCYCFILHILS